MDKDEKTRLYSTLDKIENRLDSIDVTLVRQNVTLEEHIKRTKIAEENLNILSSRIEPLEIRIKLIDQILKAIGLLFTLGSTFTGLIAGILKIVHFFN